MIVLLFADGFRWESIKDAGSKNMKKAILVASLSLAVSTAALSENNQGQNNDDQGWSRPSPRVRAPEISPADAMGAVALLGGAVAILRGYRRKEK